jgi:hypothetical protein
VSEGNTYLLALVPFSENAAQYVVVGDGEYQLSSGSFSLNHVPIDSIPHTVREADLPTQVLGN